MRSRSFGWVSWDLTGFVAACAMAATLSFSRAAFNLFAGVLLISWLLSGRFKRSLKQVISSMPLLAAVLLFLWILFSMSYSPAPGASLSREAAGYAKLLFLPLIVAFLDTRERVKGFLLTATGSLVFLLVVYLVNTWRPLPWAAGASDGVPGVFDNYIVEGLYLGALALFGLTQAAIRLGQRRWIGVGLLTIGLLAAYIVVFINPGRGAQLALVTSLFLVTVLFSPPGRRLWMGILSLALLFAVASQSTLMVERFRVAFKEVASGDRGLSASGGVRLAAWEVGLKIWREHPVLGQGVAGYQERVVEFSRAFQSGCTDNAVCIQPHSQYVLFLAEQGLIGGGLFVMLLMALAAPGLRSGAPPLDRLAAGFSALFAVHCLFDSGVRVDKQMFLFVIMASGLIAAHLLSDRLGGPQRQMP